MSTHRVIFTPDDYWTNPPKENPMTDRTDRIKNTPFRTLPADTVRVPSNVQLMIGAAPVAGKVDVGLLIEAPPPFGAIRVNLSGAVLHQLYYQLHEFMMLDADELDALVTRVHGGDVS